MNILHFHENHHIGDILITIIVFYNIKDFLENNNTTIYFYIPNEHIEQVKDFVTIRDMKILDFSKKPNNSLEIWDCNDYYFEKNSIKNKYSLKYSGLSQNEYYVRYFNARLKQINIPVTLNNFCYEDKDLLIRYNNLNGKYKNIDILFINSDPMSGQYTYDEKRWKYAIQFLNSRYNLVTTKKIEGVLCTRDDDLKLKDIAAISTNVKVVIAINTGPIVPLYNKYTFSNVKKFYIFSNNTYYSFPNFENKKYLRDISLEELDSFINN